MENLYGFVDENDKSLQTQEASVVFGLNQGYQLTKFQLEENAGKDNTPGLAIDVAFKKNPGDENERALNNRYYPVTKVYHNNEPIEAGHPEFEAVAVKEVRQLNASIMHILGRFVPQAELKNAFSSLPPTAGFKEFAELAVRLLPPNAFEKKVDIFMEYQWSIKGDNDKTYLQVPRNLKGGAWLTEHVPGNFTEDTSEGGKLKYVDSNTGAVHPFVRTANYMQSPKANQQTDSGSAPIDMGGQTAAQPAAGAKSW